MRMYWALGGPLRACFAGAAALLLMLAWASPAHAQLFAVTGDGATDPETLFTLDPSSATPTLVQMLGNGDDGEALAFNPDDGLLYHLSGRGVQNVEEIFETINPASGAVTGIPLLGADAGEVFSLTYAGAGRFLVADESDSLYSLTTGGFLVLLGGALDTTTKGLAFAGATLYSVAAFDAELRTINPATGATTGMVTMTIAGGTIDGANGLATNPADGKLYALLKVSGLGLTGRALATIDPATGVATLIGDTGDKFAAIAFSAPAPAPAPGAREGCGAGATGGSAGASLR